MALSTTRVLGLAVGGGGLERGIAGALRRVGRTSRLVCAVEIEAYAGAVLATRMEEQAMDAAPIWSDLRTFDARPWRGVVDLVAAGYPCQPFSVAGHRRGSDDPRHLWPHVARVVRDVEPAICVFENVSGHVSCGAREVIGELQGMGFDTAATLWTAAEVGAPHRRERLFIVAAHADRVRELQPSGGEQSSGGRPSDGRGWPLESGFCRVAHGVADRVERLRLLGNGVVPQQAEAAIGECFDALGIGW